MSPRILVFSTLFATVLAGLPAFGQGTTGTPTQGGTSSGAGSTGSGTGTGAGTGATTTAPSRTPTITPSPTQTPQPVTPPQPIFVSGRVMLSDGTPPPDPVVIERLCGGGSPKAEGYTDSKGYFGFEVGRQNSGILQDASQGGFGSDPFSASASGSMLGGGNVSAGMGSDQRLMTCELRARLAGYRSQSVSLANRRAMDNPDIGIILLHRIGASEGSLVTATIASAPKDSRKAYEKGLDLLKKKKPAEAAKEFEKAVSLYPRHAGAWHELGKLQFDDNQPEAARASFAKAIEADPKYVGPYLSIAVLELRAAHWRELADITDTTVKLDPFDYPQAFFLNAVAHYNLKELDAAEKSARTADQLDTRRQYPQNLQLLGLILAQRQDFAGAAEQFRTYLKVAPQGALAATVQKQLEQAEKISAGAVPPRQQ
jgi:tetratricopeptide (TPR) repeat protein